MEEIGIQVSKEVSCLENLIIKIKLFNQNKKIHSKVEENDSKSFIISSQYEQLENDDLYTKFKVRIFIISSILFNIK